MSEKEILEKSALEGHDYVALLEKVSQGKKGMTAEKRKILLEWLEKIERERSRLFLLGTISFDENMEMVEKHTQIYHKIMEGEDNE